MNNVFHCPNCGENIKFNIEIAECNYCGSTFDIILNEIDEVEGIYNGNDQM